VRSSQGIYFSKLDHVRAVAAYLVFIWHFQHLSRQDLYAVTPPAPFPFAILHESHTGVALFMTLSGFLFAKIIGDNQVDVVQFWRNRGLRLAPLLLVSFGLAALCAAYLDSNPVSLRSLIEGFVLPTWPLGAWSIAIELHFYLLLPALILLVGRFSPTILLALVAMVVLLRAGLWLYNGHVYYWSYWTIVGRFDQFALGMFFALAAFTPRSRAWLAGCAVIGFAVFWQWVDASGGYYNLGGAAASSPLWIIVPTAEAVTYGALIAWYQASSFKLPALVDRALSSIGQWSYSIYLLHFYFWIVARHFTRGLVPEMSFAQGVLFSTLCFVVFLPVAAGSYSFFERPFLKFRTPYLRKAAVDVPPARTVTLT